MGVFSWKTQDTNKSISATGNMGDRPTFTVYMVDNNGRVWQEDAYEGYGVFGGKDFYELLAEMNGLGSDRSAGISLAFSSKQYFSPNLAESPDWHWMPAPPENCEHQGYFYDEDSDDEDDDEDPYKDDWDAVYNEDNDEEWEGYVEDGTDELPGENC